MKHNRFNKTVWKTAMAIAFVAVMALAGTACGQMEGGVEPMVEPQGTVMLEVTALEPAMVPNDPAGNGGQDGQTRVTLSEDNLIWEGDETLGIIFGAAKDTSGGPGGPKATLNSVSNGRFKGAIDFNAFNLRDYSMSNVKAISIPADRHLRYELYSGKDRLATPVAGMQVQRHDGVINGEYVPLFAWVKGSQLRQEDGKYTLDGVQLNYGCALVRYHIYGTAPDMAADEIFRSIAIQCTSKAITGTGYFYPTTGFSSSVTGNVSTPVVVTLTEACTAAGRTLENALQIYAAIMPRYSGGTTPVLSKITVTTDKAVYEKSVSVTLKPQAGHLIPMGIDLSTFTKKSTVTTKTPKQLKRNAVDSLVFNGYPYFYNKPIKVYTFIPSDPIASRPVLISMHGSGRTGYTAANNWKSIATGKRVIVLAPCFDSDQYANSYYQLGNVSWSTSVWDPKPHYLLTYNVIEAVFDYFKAELGLNATKYDLWGHSAGSQFSHRMMLHMPEARANRIICSNAGYYTVPDPGGISNGTTTFDFPYSVLGMEISRDQLAAYFARDLTVHLGTADTDSTAAQDDQLPTGAGAYAQGKCRFARGHFFYERSKAVADSMGLPFNWKLVEVEGVAHSSSKMSQNTTNGAGVLLYGK